MPIIDLKKMPKSKPKIIMIQAIIIFSIITFPLAVFGSYYFTKDFVWGTKTNTVKNKDHKFKEIKSVFNIRAELKDGYAMSLVSVFGKRLETNRQVYLTIGNTFNSVNIQISESKKTELKPVEGQANNGFIKSEFVEINDIKDVIVLYQDLAGQKIARISNSAEPNSIIYFDLNSKKLGSKDLNAKTPQPDTFFYNTKLKLFPELNSDKTIVLISIKGNINKTDELTVVDEFIKNLKVTN